jgi:NAD-dependent dihydropyrimidine dehydrogenase PreA subunit
LTLAEKRRAKMGLAVIDAERCLPRRGKQDCDLCYVECNAAGYHAIEMRPMRLAVGDVPAGAVSEEELEEMGRIAVPFVKPDACVGCGLCEYRCHAVHVKQRRILAGSAVVVVPTSGLVRA